MTDQSLQFNNLVVFQSVSYQNFLCFAFVVILLMSYKNIKDAMRLPDTTRSALFKFSSIATFGASVVGLVIGIKLRSDLLSSTTQIASAGQFMQGLIDSLNLMFRAQVAYLVFSCILILGSILIKPKENKNGI